MFNFLKWFRKRERVTIDRLTPERVAQIRAHVMLEGAEEDRLFDEWREGPGKDWPRHIEMRRSITGAPLAPVAVWDAGWMTAFGKYCEDQRFKIALLERKRPDEGA